MTGRRGFRCRLLLAALGFASALIPVCQSESLEFSSPEKSIPFPVEIGMGMSVPRWIHGRMVSVWPRLQHGDSRANVHVYDAGGQKVYEARVWPPDATRVTLLDMAVSRGGDVAVVGVANNRSGQPEYFFAHVGPSGVASPAVTIQPFEGQRATFGPDGTLWILGWELDEARRFAPGKDHATLRRYARDGTLLGEFLPWSSFGCSENQHPALGTEGGRPELLASGDRIVVLSSYCGQVVELTPDGEILRRVPIEAGLLPPFAAAITSDNTIYMTRHSPSLSLCRLQLEDASCEEIQTPPGHALIGADGPALVLRNQSVLEWRTTSTR